jgi:hypothetical protein
VAVVVITRVRISSDDVL